MLMFVVKLKSMLHDLIMPHLVPLLALRYHLRKKNPSLHFELNFLGTFELRR